jgi:large subunit ribosomal protein L19e
MNLKGQRRLAASILKIGENRVWIDPERIEEVESVITREEIRKLIDEGIVKPSPVNSSSRGRIRSLQYKKKIGRRRGQGTRKGGKYSVLSRKKRWMNKIRTLRKRLRELRRNRIITVRTYRDLYLKTKGGEFRSLSEMERYITENNLRRRTFG